MIPEQILNFLNLLSRGILALFTSLKGLIIIASALLVWLVISLTFEILQQKRLAAAGNTKLNWFEIFIRSLKMFTEKLFAVSTYLPVVIMTIFIALGISALTQSVFQIKDFVDNTKKIQELNTALKHLDRQYQTAKIRVENITGENLYLKISFYDFYGKEVKTQLVKLKGREFFIDSLVCNFQYSQIENGEKINLTIPYKIFSDQIPPEKGINLLGTDSEGIPFVYKRNPEDLYGITESEFSETLKTLAEILESDKAAKEKGIIRSIYGNAIHKRPETPGEEFILWTLQSGGLNLSPPAL